MTDEFRRSPGSSRVLQRDILVVPMRYPFGSLYT